MNKTLYQDLSDRELIQRIKEAPAGGVVFNHLNNELFRRYEKQIHRNWYRLLNQLSHTDLVKNLKDEYYSEAYGAFYEAVLAVDVSKIKDNNWKFVGYLDFYLKNVRTSMCVFAERYKDVKSTDVYEDDDGKSLDRVADLISYNRSEFEADPAYIAAEVDESDKRKKLVETAYRNWPQQTRLIYDLWKAGYKKVEIAEALKIKDSVVYTTTDRIKKELQTLAKKHRID